MKYASRREIYTAVSNLDARNARTGGPRVEIACCGACGATFPPNLPIFPSVLGASYERLKRLTSVLRASQFPALSELLSPSRNLSGNGVDLYYEKRRRDGGPCWGARQRANESNLAGVRARIDGLRVPSATHMAFHSSVVTPAATDRATQPSG